MANLNRKFFCKAKNPRSITAVELLITSYISRVSFDIYIFIHNYKNRSYIWMPSCLKIKLLKEDNS